MNKDQVQFQCTYQHKATGLYYRTIGFAYDPDNNHRIILYIPVGLKGTPYYRSEEEFLNLFRYIGA